MIVKPDDAVLDYFRYQKTMIIAEQEVRQFFKKYESWYGREASCNRS
jgi:hypothetical protein